MVDITAVKKRKKKRIILLTTSISSVLMVALIIVAFLSSYVGNFTISIVNWDSKIALATVPNPSTDEQTTYLKGPGFGAAVETTCLDNSYLADGSFDTDIGGDKSTTMTVGKGSATAFYVYTFFVKNVGSSLIQYYYGFNLTGDTADSTDGLRLTDIIRIRVYQNLYTEDTAAITHSYIDYTQKNELGENTTLTGDYKNYYDNSLLEAEAGTLKYFDTASSNFIVSDDSPYRLEQGGVLRYTIVIWVEGNDPDTIGKDYPEEASLRLSAYIGSRSSDTEENK